MIRLSKGKKGKWYAVAIENLDKYNAEDIFNIVTKHKMPTLILNDLSEIKDIEIDESSLVWVDKQHKNEFERAQN